MEILSWFLILPHWLRWKCTEVHSMFTIWTIFLEQRHIWHFLLSFPVWLSTCLSSHCQFLLLLLISLILFRCPHLSWGVPIRGEKCFTIGLLWIGLLCPKLIREILSLVLLIQNRQPPQWKPMRHKLFLRSSLKGVFLPFQTLRLFMDLEEKHIARDSVGVMIKHENDTFSITSLDTVCSMIIKLLE